MPEYQHLDISKLLHCGAYALLRRGEVVYVGKSKKPLVRLCTHLSRRGKEMSENMWGGYSGPQLNGKGIKFDGVWFWPCMLGQLDVIEVALIRKYEPRYNILGRSGPFMPIPDEIKALLKQMVVITSLPPQDDTFQRFIPRRL